MKLGLAAAFALALIAAAPGAAREAGPGRILAQMPKELAGAPVKRLPDDILMYMLKGPSGEPVAVGVTVVQSKEASPSRVLGTRLRALVSSRTGIHKILREGTFTTPKWPAASTFFGDYVTGESSNQGWIVLSGKDVITVVVTYDREKDGEWAEALVGDKIFGGAVISARKPAE